jgi:2-keto-4-pentenoate hydratase/2-oxohepta-3-ene-1,7-dioic acid hydratase in catechol pathway
LRYCRFNLGGKAEFGLIESIAGKDMITRLLTKSPESGLALEDLPSKGITQIPFEQAELLAPVNPSKIVCVGRNYREHAAEMGAE